MNIDRHNYEEYFILYMDKELGSDERRMVEDFIQLHPDLKEELDHLLHYKLKPDTSVVFNGKEELMKVNGETPISLSNYEEWLVLYTDNELNAAQQKTVEQFAAANPSVKEELDLMMKAKLQPEEIVFPFKQSLYRKEEKVRVVPFNWKRMAAAAIIIALGITTVIVINSNKKQAATGQPEIATVNPGSEKQSNPVTNDQSTNTVDPVVAEKISDKPVNETAVTNTIKQTPSPEIKQQDKNTIAVKNDKPVIDKHIPPNNPQPIKQEDAVAVTPDKVKSNNLPTPLYNPNATITGNTDVAIEKNISNPTTKSDGITSPAVTNPTTQPSEISNPDVSFASLEEGSNNKKSRGLFRKIARTFEKRTNLPATDDNRLLVAGLSFKLK